jgi:Putative beta-lactamase-inhibitor-like, PepSY-like
MKSLLILFYFVGLTVSANGQVIPQSQVPPVVLKAFQEKFGSATDVKWETKTELYKAEFKVNKRGHDVWIDKTGKITKTKEDFPKKDLPAAIQQQITSEFKAYKLDDADKIEMDGKIFYQVELDGTSDDRKVLFSADGKVQENTVD